MYRFVKKLYRSWFIEIIIVVVAVMVLFFYSRIGEFMSGLSNGNIELIAQFVIDLWIGFINWYNTLVSGQNIQSVIIVVLAIAVVLLLLIRLRWRLQRIGRLTASVCPKCSYPLSRIKRTPIQKRLSNIVPIRRLCCKKCRWKGVRLRPADPFDIPTFNQQKNQPRTEPIRTTD